MQNYFVMKETQKWIDLCFSCKECYGSSEWLSISDHNRHITIIFELSLGTSIILSLSYILKEFFSTLYYTLNQFNCSNFLTLLLLYRNLIKFDCKVAPFVYYFYIVDIYSLFLCIYVFRWIWTSCANLTVIFLSFHRYVVDVCLCL